MDNLYNETRDLLKKYGIAANKSLGQNFLINEVVVENIIQASDISRNDLVIEIGPGLGTLTKPLLGRAGKVICIELDTKMVDILEDRFKGGSKRLEVRGQNKFKIINEDVLKIDLNRLIEEEIGDLKNVKIVANLPYYITTPIVMKLLEDRLNVKSITIMIQKEVADRLACTPGDKDSGAITYSVFYYATAQKVCTVQNNSFIPEPAVVSEVIKLTLRDRLAVEVKNEKNLFKVIKAAFMQRRKTLLNGLSNSGLFKKEELKEIFKELNLNENIRGEKLTLEQFAKISEYL